MSDDARWKAVERRDGSFDGRFVFGVVTTGVYCRPSCAARRPLRRNVRFFDGAAEAEQEGLRACRRCKPGKVDDGRALMRRACDALRLAAEEPEAAVVARVAAEVGLTERTFRRAFRAAVGVAPKQYLEACRVEALRRSLRTSDSIALAIYEAGYGSGSRVYERADERLGMTPGQYAKGGANVDVVYASAPTPLGKMVIAATERGVCWAQFGKDDEALVKALTAEFPKATVRRASAKVQPAFDAWVEAVCAHLKGDRPHLDVPLDVDGTALQFRVWRFLQTIPRGEVRSYSEVARSIGKPKAVRAVARACASNRAALLIPCHRVLRADGELGGYRWGLERKRDLLKLERRSA